MLTTKVGHKWALDRATGEVVPAADVGSFCSTACSLQSKALSGPHVVVIL